MHQRSGRAGPIEFLSAVERNKEARLIIQEAD
jgi:hypothetical protein